MPTGLGRFFVLLVLNGGDCGLTSEMLRSRHGFTTITRHAECEYLVPAALYDRIVVRLISAVIGHSSVQWGFEFKRLVDDALVARGEITVVAIDLTGAPIEVPLPFQEAIKIG